MNDKMKSFLLFGGIFAVCTCVLPKCNPAQEQREDDESFKHAYETQADYIQDLMDNDSTCVARYREYAKIVDAREDDSTSYTQTAEDSAYARYEAARDSIEKLYMKRYQGFTNAAAEYGQRVQELQNVKTR